MVDTNTLYQTQVLIIGAGPSGLYSAFALGLLGVSCSIIDVLPQPGGQCIELYADKLIYDIPAIKECKAADLIERLLDQIKPFNPVFHFKQLASDLKIIASDQQRLFEIRTDKGLCIKCQAILIASGSGAFLPRKLKLDGLEKFVDRQVFYSGPSDINKFSERHVIVHGDQEQSLQLANQFASLPVQNRPAKVTLIHRRDKFRADEQTINQTQELRKKGVLQFFAGTLNGIESTQEQLNKLEIKISADNSTIHIPADALFILNGTSPSLGPIENWPLKLENKLLTVDPATFQTSEPGIYAAGDAVSYPGKRKLIVSGFHEATLAAYAIASYLNNSESIPLQYTSSNTALQNRLKKI